MVAGEMSLRRHRRGVVIGGHSIWYGMVAWLAVATLEGGMALSTEHLTSDPAAETPTGQPPIVEETGREVREDVIDRDAPPATPYAITPNLFWGAEIEFEFEYENNFDLDDGAADDLLELDPTLSVAVAYVPTNWLLGYVSFSLSRDVGIIDEGRNSVRKTNFTLSRAYVRAEDILVDGLSAQIGRQRFADEREWLFDRVLDAGRLTYEAGDFELEFAIGRRTAFNRDFLNKTTRDRINTYIGLVDYEVVDDVHVGAFSVFRDDRSERRGQPVIFGLRSYGEVDIFDDEIAFWLDLATVRGDDKGTDIEGYAADVGATYIFNVPFDPYVTLGYAYGSGDNDPDDGTDEEFRQSGLEGNAAKFGGVTRIKYYGETFDPELRNLHVLTAGVGFRPTRRSSIDFVYHIYRQDEFSDRTRGSPIDLDPNEDPARMSKSLGSEFDIVVGYKDVIPDVDIEFVFGYFFAGDAFRVEVATDVFQDADDAIFAGFEIEYEF